MTNRLNVVDKMLKIQLFAADYRGKDSTPEDDAHDVQLAQAMCTRALVDELKKINAGLERIADVLERSVTGDRP